MNCHEVHEHLPELLDNQLAGEKLVQLQAHLAGCSACRQAKQELRQVTRMLTATAAPAVQVDLTRLYRQAAQQEQQRFRRWRRIAYAACGALAAILLLAIGLNLEVRVEKHQLTLRWGSPPPDLTPPSDDLGPRIVYIEKDSTATAERLRLLNELVQALATDGRTRDLKQQEELSQLQVQLHRWQEQSVLSWTTTRQDVAALYAAQFLTRKGTDQ